MWVCRSYKKTPEERKMQISGPVLRVPDSVNLAWALEYVF